MKTICSIESSDLTGSLALPPSKSHTMRAILLASLAKGTSYIYNILPSPDTTFMIEACRALGATISGAKSLEIIGRGEKRVLQKEKIDVGNSGQILRFVGALSALSNEYILFTGDHSIRTKRPCGPLLDGLQQLGAFAESCANNQKAPFVVKGPVKSGVVTIDGSDSQPVSALLFLASLLEGVTTIHVQNLGERPWIQLTLSWLRRLGIEYYEENTDTFVVKGVPYFSSFTYSVPGDLSALMYPVAYALCTKSDIVVENVDLEDTQGDKKVLELFSKMGAALSISDNTISIKGSQELQGIAIDCNDCIDALPLLAVIGTYAVGKTTLYNAKICRYKECDRIAAITTELRTMGAKIEELDDGLVVYQSQLYGSCQKSYDDHRMVLSLFLAGLIAKGSTAIHNTACVVKSFPGFFEAMRQLGAKCTQY